MRGGRLPSARARDSQDGLALVAMLTFLEANGYRDSGQCRALLSECPTNYGLLQRRPLDERLDREELRLRLAVRARTQLLDRWA
jgi:hypothetical protein